MNRYKLHLNPGPKKYSEHIDVGSKVITSNRELLDGYFDGKTGTVADNVYVDDELFIKVNWPDMMKGHVEFRHKRNELWVTG